MTIRVRRAGTFTTVQDLGRHGWQHDGVPEGGAMDALALRLANLLVGNAESDAALEITLDGPTLAFDDDVLVALCGADVPCTIDGASVPTWRTVHVRAGAVLATGAVRAGCRALLAVSGGIDVPRVLGSRATYVRAGLGGLEGRALRTGDVLPVGSARPLSVRMARALAARGERAAGADWGVAPTLRALPASPATVRLIAGAHLDALAPASREVLFAREFRVSPQSDRMGYRLEGPALALTTPRELLSEAVAFGTVQLPPGGAPIILMADRQTTGGYPRLGEVATIDHSLLAQLRPGDRLRFAPISLAEAQAVYLARERDVARLARAIELRHH